MSRRQSLTFVIAGLGATALGIAGCTAPPAAAPQAAAQPTPVTAPPPTAPAPTSAPATSVPAKPAATSAPAAAPTSAPQPTPATAAGAARNGDIKVAITGFPTAWDSLFATSNALYLVQNVLDPLVFIGPELKPQPALAKSWNSPDGGKTWEFQLADTTWHDGTPFTSKDVKSHYDRMLDPATGSGGKAVFDVVDAVEVPDPHVVRFKLKVADNNFPILTGSYQGPIQPSHVDPATFKTAPMVGTGPFKWDEVTPGQSIRLAANPNYHISGQPKVNTLTFIAFQDAQAQLNALLSGAVDVTALPAPLLERVKNNPDFSIVQSLAGSFATIYLRGDQAPGNNPKVVQALKMSLDRPAMLQALRGGYGVVTGDNPVVPGSPDWIDVGVPQRDVAAARSLLEQAGFKDGLDLELTAGDDQVDIAQAIQSMAGDAGFKINITTKPSQTLFAQDWLKLNFGIDGWSPRPTLDAQLRVAFTCAAVWNEGHWCDNKFDSMLDEARASSDAAKRQQLNGDLQRYVAANGTVIVPYHYPNVTVVSKRVQNFKEHAMGVWTDYRPVSLTS
jgi:peptide/nickel transport system substrate-binding protein